MLEYQLKRAAKTDRQVKLCAALCLGLGLIIASTFSSYFWDLSQRATLYTENQTTLKTDLVYDNCLDPVPTDASLTQLNTHWALVYKMNAIVYTMLTGMIMCSCTGLIYNNIFNATLNCLTLGGLAHVVAIIMAGVYLLRESGKTCVQNVTDYDNLGNSFESDGALL